MGKKEYNVLGKKNYFRLLDIGWPSHTCLYRVFALHLKLLLQRKQSMAKPLLAPFFRKI